MMDVLVVVVVCVCMFLCKEEAEQEATAAFKGLFVDTLFSFSAS